MSLLFTVVVIRSSMIFFHIGTSFQEVYLLIFSTCYGAIKSARKAESALRGHRMTIIISTISTYSNFPVCISSSKTQNEQSLTHFNEQYFCSTKSLNASLMGQT